MQNAYNKFFETITSYSPYKFQSEVGQNCLHNRNNMLQAPTGSGKTLAAIVPFLYAWKQWKEGSHEADKYPRKLIYSLPLRTLANSIYKDVKDLIDRFGEVINYPDVDIDVRIQTGEYNNDRHFEADIIITTIDQTLSSFLSTPYSLPLRQANINAGAVFSSYLIFDEIHLLGGDTALPTVITALKKYKEFIPFTLMTATMSDSFFNNTADYLNADKITVSNQEYEEFQFVKAGAKKELKAVYNQSINVENIISKHENCSIVICNTVARCLEVYNQILNHPTLPENTKVICIHSRFFQKDRARIEKQIGEYFGKGSNKGNVILVSTQVIEAGLNITCDTMHTEIAPINSLIQRIGRCARFSGKGRIYVYDKPEDSTYLPYKGDRCEKTYRELNKYVDCIIDDKSRQDLINIVMVEHEDILLQNIIEEKANILQNIIKCWKNLNLGDTQQLIRNINSINVVILSPTDKVKSLYQYESLSLHPHTLINNARKYNLYVYELIEDNGEFESALYRIHDLNQITRRNIVALDYSEIQYNSNSGLDLSKIGNERKSQFIDSAEIDFNRDWQIKKDTYQEHIEAMLKYYSTIADTYSYLATKIEDKFSVNHAIDKLVRLIITSHDFGKLSNQWQKFVRVYQSMKEQQEVKDFLAHTDFDINSDEDRDLINKTKKTAKKPPHAGISAHITGQILAQIFDITKREDKEICYVLLMTILKHHNAFSEKCNKYNLNSEVQELISRLVREYSGFEVELQSLTQEQNKKLKYEPQFGTTWVGPLYFYLSRLLRLCDQHSFEMIKH